MISKISVSLSKQVIEQLDLRGRRSSVIEGDLHRLYTLYRRSLARVQLTVNEACLIVDALNGHLTDPNSAHLLWAEILDAIEMDKVDKKWKVDGQALVEKLRSLNETECLAISDAAERFWIDPSQDIREGVKKCFESAIEDQED